MEQQTPSVELLQTCKEIIEKNIQICEEEIKLSILRIQTYDKMIEKYASQEVYMGPGHYEKNGRALEQSKEMEQEHIEGCQESLEMWKKTTPEEYLQELIQYKKEAADTTENKYILGVLLSGDEYIASLPEAEKKHVQEVKQYEEKRLFREALEELGIEEDDAGKPRHEKKIRAKLQELKKDRIETIKKRIANSARISDQSLEEYTDERMASTLKSLMSSIGCRRSVSLVQAMGMQSGVYVAEAKRNGKMGRDIERPIDLGSKTISKIAQLTEDQFKQMVVAFAEDKKLQEKVSGAERRFTLMERLDPALPVGVFGLGVASILAGAGLSMPEMQEVGRPIFDAGLVVAVSSIPLAILSQHIPDIMKDGSDITREAVARYIKGLPINEAGNLETSELGSN